MCSVFYTCAAATSLQRWHWYSLDTRRLCFQRSPPQGTAPHATAALEGLVLQLVRSLGAKQGVPGRGRCFLSDSCILGG